MFTGIVREVGTVAELRRASEGAQVRVRASAASELGEGDSVAVNGVCLTVSQASEEEFSADVMNQTLALTTLGQLEPGARVNLEPAVRAGEPFGGHLVQGHVDGRATVTAIEPDGFARRLRFGVPSALRRYVAERGSVAVNGVSLTVAALAPDGLEVSLIPETLERTTLSELREGSEANLEVDVVARYAERLVGLNDEGTED